MAHFPQPKPRQQKIRVTPARGQGSTLRIGGWLHGRHSYLWMGDKDGFLGFIGDRKLYRLAKAIVRHYEAER